MKKLTLTFIIILFVFSLANAQFTKIGGGLALSSGFPFHNMPWPENKSGVIALSFKGIYKINVPFHLSPSFTIFYPHITKFTQFTQYNAEETTTVSSMMFDFNGHYVFNSLDRYEFYGLAGFDILLAGEKNVLIITDPPKTTIKNTESDNALGLNLGVGTYMKLTEQFDLSGEVKYVFNNKYNQLMVNVGILLNLDWMKKNESSGL